MYDNAHGGNDTLIGRRWSDLQLLLGDTSDMYDNSSRGGMTR